MAARKGYIRPEAIRSCRRPSAEPAPTGQESVCSCGRREVRGSYCTGCLTRLAS